MVKTQHSILKTWTSLYDYEQFLALHRGYHGDDPSFLDSWWLLWSWSLSDTWWWYWYMIMTYHDQNASDVWLWSTWSWCMMTMMISAKCRCLMLIYDDIYIMMKCMCVCVSRPCLPSSPSTASASLPRQSESGISLYVWLKPLHFCI